MHSNFFSDDSDDYGAPRLIKNYEWSDSSSDEGNIQYCSTVSFYNEPIYETSEFVFGAAPKPVMQKFLPPELPLTDPVNRQRIDNPVSSGAFPSQTLRNYEWSDSSSDEGNIQDSSTVSFYNAAISGTSRLAFGAAPKPVIQNNPYGFLSPELPLPDPVNRQRIGNSVSFGALLSQSFRNSRASGSSADTAFFGTVTSSLRGVHEMKIGSVTFQVKSGDITKEKTDVIVNSSNQDFTLYSGVSKAILKAAGPPIASSAAALGSQPHKGYVITGSGRLRQIIWILHVVGPVNPTSLMKTILDVLQECENLQVSSVTFPALGTGAGRLAAYTVAGSILDGLVDFINAKSVRSLQTVKVVLLQQPMLTDFYMSMKMREGSALPEDKSLLTRLSDGDTLRLPSHWTPMGGTRVMEVNVPPGTPEYSAVLLKFLRSCENQIVKILRVQNRDLWLQYQIKKQNIDYKNRSITNEKELFHGTDSDSIQHINHNGFNRSYAGKHAAVYGNGTYFAVNANYSAIETYSNPDGDGERHMYLARVLTGLYCVGCRGLVTPPAKNAANSTDLYDSVTDKVRKPSMFVIFNDVQAYPEYHIVFQ